MKTKEIEKFKDQLLRQFLPRVLGEDSYENTLLRCQID